LVYGNKKKWGKDVSETTHYVAYYVAPQQRNGVRSAGALGEGREAGDRSQAQHQAVQDFIQERNRGSVLVESFTEIPDSRRAVKWPQLQKALEACKRHHATLLIAELGTYTSNENFTQLLLDAGQPFHCLDQPFVNLTILEALSKHARVQRKLHGKLIREGLKMTSAKSGNPNAAEVISKVNKPKIDTAIVFAFLLQPIIQDYRRKGYSQRQMVKTLNDEGFTAPEGGKWVLSQLQKVLDRVRLNEIATEAKPLLDTLAKDAPLAQITQALNNKGLSSLKRGPWDEAQVKKLCDRVQQIQDIVLINRFVLDLLPILHAYRQKGLDAQQMLKEFQQAGCHIRQEVSQGSSSHAHGDKNIGMLLDRLKQDLRLFPEGAGYLDLCFESAAKHIPAYLKIVKGHIEQLARVLELETHDHRKLETVGLAEPVTQLMQLFRELNDQDIQLLDSLSYEARNWQGEAEASEASRAAQEQLAAANETV
jgi:hypothetical protein